jgi:hypothetical protein
MKVTQEACGCVEGEDRKWPCVMHQHPLVSVGYRDDSGSFVPVGVRIPDDAVMREIERVAGDADDLFDRTCAVCMAVVESVDALGAHEESAHGTKSVELGTEQAISGEASAPGFPDLPDVAGAGSAPSPEIAPDCECGWVIPATSKNPSASMRMHLKNSKVHRE